MHPRTILAIARKDAIDVLLNKATIITLLIPILIALLFLFLSKLLGGHTTNILVYNPGRSPVVQLVSKAFEQTHITETSSPGDVTAAFGPNGASKNSLYDVGLIVPDGFENALQAGTLPQVILYINGNNLDSQDSLLIQAAITNYARKVVSAQPPILLTTSMVNPPPASNIGKLSGSYYGVIALLISFTVGTSLMPGLLIEEKEKKTLRMLMVAPASFTDVILGKLLVALIYQLLISLTVVAIQGGFTGQIPLLLLYMVLGASLSLALGLLLGGIFQTTSTAGAVAGMTAFIYSIPAIFSGPPGTLFGNNPLVSLVKIFPTYYIADGVYHAVQNQGTLNGHLLDIAVVIGTTLVLVAITAWTLRRQSAVTASI